MTSATTPAPLRVLVADDDRAQRILTRELVRGAGVGAVDVVCTSSADEVRAHVAAAPFDIFLLDYRLGADDGLALATELLAGGDERIVMLQTAYTDPALDVQAVAAGLSDVLAKQVMTHDGVGRAIRYALQRRDDRRALRESARRYRQLARNLPDAGIVTCDAALTIQTVEGELFRGLGIDVDALSGTDLRVQLERLGLLDQLELYARALRGEHVDHAFTGPGDRRYLIRFGPVRDDGDDTIAGAMSVALDVTGQHRAEVERNIAQRELVEARRRFEVAFEGAVVGSAIASPEGRYLEANEALARMLGRTREELVGATIAELTHPDDRAETAAFVRGALAGERERGQFEKRFITPDGRPVPVLISTALVRDGRGAPLYFTAQMLDLTAHKAAEEAAEAGRQRQRLVLANLPGTIVTLHDHDLRVLDVDGLDTTDASGRTQAATVGRHLRDLVSLEAYAVLAPRLRAALDGDRQTFAHVTDEGRELHVDIAPFREDGTVTGALGVWRDVTDERGADRARREAERQMQIAFDAAPIGMAMVALDGALLRVNAALGEIVGRDPHALIADPPLAAVHPEDRERVRRGLAVLGRDVESAQLEHRLLRAGGDAAWVEARVTLVRDDDGAPRYALAQITDITERRHHEDALRRLALHDPLTGLANRRAFDDELARRREHGHAGAVMLLDIDGFKAINDTLGHAAGDDLIVAVARVLGAQLRDGDTLARMGGDEFAIMLPGAGREDAEAIAARLVEAVRTQVATTRITISVGVRMLDGTGSGERAMADADAAMYVVKHRGRDGFHVATPA